MRSRKSNDKKRGLDPLAMMAMMMLLMIAMIEKTNYNVDGGEHGR
jgi:hypothetical protein